MMSDRSNSIIETLRIHGSPANLIPITIRLPQDLEQDIRAVAEREGIRLSVALRASLSIGWQHIRDELEGE